MQKRHQTAIRLLIVDDHAVMRQGLSILLNQQPHLTIVAEAGTGAEAQNAALRFQPDLILLDLQLPDTTAEYLCPELRRLSPHSKILVLSGVEASDPVYRAVDAGIDGYILKGVDMSELVAAIEQVAAGYSYLHPSITRLILHRAARQQQSAPTAVSADAYQLTKRQKQVLMLMASTATTRDIAERLSISEETVRSHVKHILRKLNQSSRTQAVLEAVRIGLITV